MRGLYAIVDPEHCGGRPPVDVARAILRGGCAVLQLRAKLLDDAQYLALGGELRAACREANVPFVVNDRAWLARELGADGVHLGQNDLPLAQARALLGGKVWLGLSTHSLAQALQAARLGADLIGIGPVFATRTKPDADPVLGLAALAAVRAAVTVPLVAIGGITPHNAAGVRATGVPLLAAISSLCSARDVEDAARRLHG